MENPAVQAYKDIFKLMNKHKDICIFDVDDMERKAANHLFGIELKETYGLNINPKKVHSIDWVDFDDQCKFGDHLKIAYFGEKTGRKISWPDGKKQPNNELLLQIGFPTGAYIFGDHYPKELFAKLFLELKEYGAKYVDSHNNYLYYSMDNAHIVFNQFDDIMRTYHELDAKAAKERKIQKLKEDLAILENSGRF